MAHGGMGRSGRRLTLTGPMDGPQAWSAGYDPRVPEPANDVTPRCYRHPDRETLVRCSGCERPICTDCMHSTPVGIRCAECAGAPTGVRRVVQQSYRRGRVPFTVALIVVTTIMFVAQIATNEARGSGGFLGGVTGALDLTGPDVANGQWWRIVSVALTHAGIVHLTMNMISLWVVGSIVEAGLGPVRYLGIYLAAIVWGSAGALIHTPNVPTVGASGGIFGLLAAIMVVQWLRGGRVGGDLIAVMAFNLAFTFSIQGISKGGHLGGIVGGALAAFAAVGLEQHLRTTRRHQVALVALAGIVVVGIGLCLWAANRSAPVAPGS